MAEIVFHGWKSCCIRREFGVKKQHANFQTAAHGLRDCLSSEFHSRPRGRHSGSSRRQRGGGSKGGGIGLAFKPAGAGGDFTGRTGGNKYGDDRNNTRARCCSRNKYSHPNACAAGVNRNPAGGHTNSVRNQCCSSGCSRAAS